MANNDSPVTAIQPSGKEEETSGFPTKKEQVIPQHINSPVKAYTVNIGRRRAPSLQWETSEWDLAECGRICDVESYVRRAMAVKESAFLKEGYEFVGSNPRRVAYIKKRLQQIEHAGGIPFDLLLAWTVGSLMRTSNAFWVKKRDPRASGGRKRIRGNKAELLPVAAYFFMPPETVRFKRDEYGKVKQYRQVIPGKKPVEFKPEDVIHFYFDKREGFAVGTPILVPVKDDIRALRRLEENVELLYYNHIFPLFHYKVGTEKHPAMVFPDGTSEIEAVRDGIADMPADGCWVTPERHSIEVVGAEGEALDAEKVISHFKQRIYTGLGVSSVDMGEANTSNRSTAQTLSRNLVDHTKSQQNIFATFINKEVIEELLLESTFDDKTLLDAENIVQLEFKEIDKEARIALENHVSQMYLQHLFSHDQARKAIGEEPWTEEDWEKSYWRQIDEPTKMMQSLDEPYSELAKAVARANTTSVEESDRQAAETQKEKERKEELSVKRTQAQKRPQSLPTRKSANKAGTNKNQPKNQHGTRKSPKLNKDLFADCYMDTEESPATALNVVLQQRPPVRNTFHMLKQNIVSDIRVGGWNAERIQKKIDSDFSLSAKQLIDHARRACRIGITDAGVEYYDLSLGETDKDIERHVIYFVDRLKNDILQRMAKTVAGVRILKQEDAVLAEMLLDVLSYRFETIDEHEVLRAYNQGLVIGYKTQDVENIKFLYDDTNPCKICGQSTLQRERTTAIIFNELPPLRLGCRCTVKKT